MNPKFTPVESHDFRRISILARIREFLGWLLGDIPCWHTREYEGECVGPGLGGLYR